VVLAAVQQDAKALMYATQAVQDDPEIREEFRLASHSDKVAAEEAFYAEGRERAAA